MDTLTCFVESEQGVSRKFVCSVLQSDLCEKGIVTLHFAPSVVLVMPLELCDFLNGAAGISKDDVVFQERNLDSCTDKRAKRAVTCWATANPASNMAHLLFGSQSDVACRPPP